MFLCLGAIEFELSGFVFVGCESGIVCGIFAYSCHYACSEVDGVGACKTGHGLFYGVFAKGCDYAYRTFAGKGEKDSFESGVCSVVLKCDFRSGIEDVVAVGIGHVGGYGNFESCRNYIFTYCEHRIYSFAVVYLGLFVAYGKVAEVYALNAAGELEPAVAVEVCAFFKCRRCGPCIDALFVLLAGERA